MKRKVVYLGLLSCTLAVLTIGSSLLPLDKVVFVQLWWFALLGVLLVLKENPFLYPRRARFVIGFIGMYLAAAVFHFADLESVKNSLGCASALTATLWLLKGLERNARRAEVEPVLYYTIAFLLLLSFPLSVLLTRVGWPSSPDLYPWQAILMGERMHLLRGQEVGHSIAIPLAFLTGVLTLSRMQFGMRLTPAASLFALSTFTLIASQTRIGVLLALLLVFAALSSIKLVNRLFPLQRLFFIASVSAPAALLSVLLVPDVNRLASDFAYSIQSEIPAVRITSGTERHTLASGREALNARLLERSFHSPLIGLGDSDPALLFGYTSSGAIAEFREDEPKSESSLRLAVKYGWPMYIITLLFISIPLLAGCRRHQDVDSVFQVAIAAGILTLWLASGGFENFYTQSGLFMVVLVWLHIVGSDSRRASVASRLPAFGRPNVPDTPPRTKPVA